MALTNANINLIRALSEGKIQDAKSFALISLKEDKTKKNWWAVNTLTKKLACTGMSITEAMPADIQYALTGWSQRAFDPARYYHREAENRLFEKIKTMSLLAERLSDMGIEYANTVLLYGPTGTGKTEFARYVAHSLNKPLFYVNFAQTIDSYLGGTAKKIDKIISFASKWPCILLLDEIDCIALKRDEAHSGADAELSRTTVSVMQAIDNLPSTVLLMACTNKMGILDDALLRRFSIRHEVEPMSPEDMRVMANKYVKAVGADQYISSHRIQKIADEYNTPGAMFPELIRTIAEGYYAEHREELEAESADVEYADIFDVTGTYRVRVKAETEADAIAMAKKFQSGYLIEKNNGQTEWRADRIVLSPTAHQEDNHETNL